MANEQNLMRGNPETQFKTGREQSEIARQGGIASGEAKRRRKTLREQMEMLLNLPVKDDSTKDFIESLGIESNEIDNGMAITLSMYQEALKGNTKAYELIRDTIGEKLADRIQIEDAPIIKVERPKKE